MDEIFGEAELTGGENYKTQVHCKNCNRKIDIEIPKGKTIAEFIKDKHCKTCGCKELVA